MVEIRPLTKDDEFDDLVSLSRAFFAEYEAHHQHFFALDLLRDRDILDYFSGLLDDESGEVLIALHAGRVVGYITLRVQQQPGYWHVKRVGHISGLMVHEAFRRQGIARRLLDRANAFFARNGVQYYTVYTATANQGGLQFYERCGLQPLYTTLLGKVPGC
jgi:ribosomal protein S18 acetylase RimI-like enzyme